MPVADKNYRLNPARSIYICGEFTEELAARVLPEIVALRSINSDPITVYINSRGGSVRVLETIEGALRARDQDGNRCRIITSVLGEASSAAATMLTLGDYAVASPHSTVLFHGVRRSEVEVTVEEASSLAAYLSNLNASNANKISRKAIDRLLRRYVQLLPEIERIRKKTRQPKHTGELSRFIDCIKLGTSSLADSILDKTTKRIAVAEKLSSQIITPAKVKDSDTGLKQDISVFKALLKYELEKHKKSEYRLDEEAVIELVNDYFLLRDFHAGKHYGMMSSLIRIHGPSLLEKRDFVTYQSAIKGKPINEELDWLNDKIGSLLRMLWHFSVSLCRQLQIGENRLSAADAYWMGCIDEVAGHSKMVGERAVAEAVVPVPKAKA